MMLRPRASLALASVLAALAFAACGGSDGPTPSAGEAPTGPPSSSAGADPGLQHIHGLGVSGKQLIIATHGGLFTAPEGGTKAQRLGDSRQDVMGFSVIEGKNFIGSGHPAPDASAPPNLGLIESRDGGKSFENISLEGEADFHTLESSGRRVYGFDGTQGRLMVSSDAGRTWAQRKPPAGVFSLAIDPQSPNRIVTSTEQGLFESRDAGRRFRPIRSRELLAGLLVWPKRDSLFLVDGEGQVLVSRNAGGRWQPVGSIEGQPAALSADGGDLYAALTDGTVKRSTDGGRSWTIRATP